MYHCHGRALLFLAMLAGALRAESTKAQLGGTLRDPAGLPVRGATVAVTNSATGITTKIAVTSDAGLYQFLALPPGDYRLAADKDGFAPLRRENITLRAGDRLHLDLTLALGAAGEAVTVTAAPPLLQASSGAASFAVERQRVATLPLDGRNFVPLIALAPGVSLPPGGLLPRINGSRPRTSEYIYDGVSVLQPEPGQVPFYPIVDAIEEFRVETNAYSAEYGRSNGGVIMVNQKSGSNQLRGTLFEFFRHEKLNARNLFAEAGPKPVFRRNQYGFVLGGPAQRNRTFFFTDWQGTRLRTGVVHISTVPLLAQRLGVFAQPVFDPATRREPFPANTIPVARFDPRAFALLNRYPAPNKAGEANNYRRVGNNGTAGDQFDMRLDRYVKAAHRVFARYTHFGDDTRPATPLPDGSGAFNGLAIANTVTRAKSVAAEHAWTLSPSAVNQLRAAFTTRALDRLTHVPAYEVAGFQQLGPPAGANAELATSVTQLVDNYSLTRASHNLKIGADVRRQALDIRQPPNPNGAFQFTAAGTDSSFASFLLGQVSRYSIDVQTAPVKPRATVAEFYLQDDWRVTPRLTLNLGVRYTLNFPSTVVGNRGAVFNLATQQLDFLGQDGFPRSARNLEKKNFGPRIGLAWKLADSLVLRAGYGLTWIEQPGITTPFTAPLFPFVQTVGQQAPDNLQPAFVLSQGPTVAPRAIGPDAGLGQGVFGVQRDNGSGYAQQWNLSIQKTLGANWSVEAGYLGSKLTRLGVPDVNLNQLTIEQMARGDLVRPYPRFNSVALYRNNTGHSTYHSLQSRVERRFSGGLAVSASYTFSRLIDDAGAVFDSAVLTGPVVNFQAADSYNKRLEKDVSTGNVPHIFAAGFVYSLPRGWQLAGIARAQAGSPIAVTQATNLNAFAGFGIQRPHRIADPDLTGGERTTARWFNTAAFAQAPQGAVGTSSRNPVPGPGYRALDLMLGKTFALGERLRAEFRAEAFNLTNTPPLGNPNGSFGTAAFGTITTALDPRVFELVMKLHF